MKVVTKDSLETRSVDFKTNKQMNERTKNDLLALVSES